MEMQDLMAQASELQNKVAEAQEKLGTMRIRGLSADGGCIVTMTGKYDVVDVTINPDLLSRGASVVNAAVLSAMQDGKSKCDNIIDEVMGEATAGMPLPE